MVSGSSILSVFISQTWHFIVCNLLHEIFFCLGTCNPDTISKSSIHHSPLYICCSCFLFFLLQRGSCRSNFAVQSDWNRDVHGQVFATGLAGGLVVPSFLAGLCNALPAQAGGYCNGFFLRLQMRKFNAKTLCKCRSYVCF